LAPRPLASTIEVVEFYCISFNAQIKCTKENTLESRKATSRVTAGTKGLWTRCERQRFVPTERGTAFFATWGRKTPTPQEQLAKPHSPFSPTIDWTIRQRFALQGKQFPWPIEFSSDVTPFQCLKMCPALVSCQVGRKWPEGNATSLTTQWVRVNNSTVMLPVEKGMDTTVHLQVYASLRVVNPTPQFNVSSWRTSRSWRFAWRAYLSMIETFPWTFWNGSSSPDWPKSAKSTCIITNCLSQCSES